VEVYPAIDLRGGQCVRLYQGDYAKETVYGADPVGQALAFADDGASWVHVVDLDAARSGDPVNRPVVAAIAAALTPIGVHLQAGGGVRSVDDARSLFDAGVARVVMGTAALDRPALVGEVAALGAVAVGLDARNGEVATHGWEQGSGVSLETAVRRFADSGAEALVVTEIGRDGTLVGPDLEQLAMVLGSTDLLVIASGGVGAGGDLVALKELVANGRRLTGAIVGRALYDGAVTLPDAIAAARRER
jgi:phosphoribosylformimino-5-aminoimidazole carboxamide ribotide isomerase